MAFCGFGLAIILNMTKLLAKLDWLYFYDFTLSLTLSHKGRGDKNTFHWNKSFQCRPAAQYPCASQGNDF